MNKVIILLLIVIMINCVSAQEQSKIILNETDSSWTQADVDYFNQFNLTPAEVFELSFTNVSHAYKIRFSNYSRLSNITVNETSRSLSFNSNVIKPIDYFLVMKIFIIVFVVLCIAFFLVWILMFNKTEKKEKINDVSEEEVKEFIEKQK